MGDTGYIHTYKHCLDSAQNSQSQGLNLRRGNCVAVLYATIVLVPFTRRSRVIGVNETGK